MNKFLISFQKSPIIAHRHLEKKTPLAHWWKATVDPTLENCQLYNQKHWPTGGNICRPYAGGPPAECYLGGCCHMICPFVSTFLIGRRHFTVFGKYLLPFSSYISVQFCCYTFLFMYFIYYCIKHNMANFQHFRFCNLSLF